MHNMVWLDAPVRMACVACELDALFAVLTYQAISEELETLKSARATSVVSEGISGSSHK